MKSAAFVLAIFMCLAVTCACRASAVKNPDSVFGVVCPWAGTKDAGIKWIRCGAGCTALDWGAIEKERGVFDWKAADAEVRGIIAEGASPLPILGYTPKWASSGDCNRTCGVHWSNSSAEARSRHCWTWTPRNGTAPQRNTTQASSGEGYSTTTWLAKFADIPNNE